MGAPDPAALPTTDEFLASLSSAPAAPKPPPTPQQFFATSSPQSGAAADVIWSSSQDAGARLLNSVGAGIQDNWGARPLGLDPESEAAFRKAGLLNDYQKGHAEFFKSISEAVIRQAATYADAIARAPGAVLGGIQGGLSAASERAKELGSPVEAGVAGYGAETAEAVASGALGEVPALHEAARVPEVAAAERATEAARARSAGVVGEGEAGFYGAEPLTPENVAARADAAKDAGITPPPPLPPPPDIHALARRIDPETFDQYDALALERDQHRQTVAALGAEREASPEALQAQSDIDTILGKVHGVEDRLTNAARARLAEAQDRLDTALNAETPEMAAARNALMEADFKMRDLAPEVSAAYRSAQEIAPNVPEVAEPVKPAGEEAGAEEPAKEGEPEGTPPIATGAEVEAEGAPQPIPAVAAGEAGAEAEVAPGSVTGAEKLGAGTQVAEGAEKAPTASIGNPRAVQGTGERVTRGLSREVEASAIEHDLATTLGDLPEFNRLNMKDQAAKVVAFMDRDYEAAKSVAMGTRTPPADIHPASVLVGVEKRATAEGDVATITRLANSPFATRVTTAAQTIRILGERDKASPLGAIKEVMAAREAGFSKGGADVAAAKATEVAAIRNEMRKAASKPDAWQSFLKSITCEDE